MFSFEINESSLSDTRCLIQDVVSLVYTVVIKEWHETFSAELLCHEVISLECRENNVSKATV